MIEAAIALAVTAHEGQVDKAGMPYILHPLRVLSRVGLGKDDVVCAAVLHDVVEDTEISCEDLLDRGFSHRTFKLVDLLTRWPDETYEAFILRISEDKDASWIKLWDLRDNQDISRLGVTNPRDLSPMQFERVGKYYRAEQVLREKWGFL